MWVWLGASLLSMAATAGQLERTDRHVVLFQSAPAELQDRYQVGAGPYRLRNLPNAPVLGSCAFPEADIQRVDYPHPQISLAVGQSVNLWIRDPRLGDAFQSATVAWHQPPAYGLTLENGQTLRWQSGSDWAQLLRAPAQYPGLTVTGDATDDLILRCAINGPRWQAQYQGVQRGNQLELSLQALIRVPPGQNWGEVDLSLSAAVGNPGTQVRAFKMESVMVDSAGAPSLADGVWRYRFPQPVALDGGAQFSQRLWMKTAQIKRVHRINAYTSARNAATQSLSARRSWLIDNTQGRGLGVAMPPGAIRIQAQRQGDYPLAGQSQLPSLAAGASHWLDLGPSLAVSGQLEMIESQIIDQRVESMWRVTLNNDDPETATIELNLQIPNKAEMSEVPTRIDLAPGEQQQLTLRLSEARR